MFGWRGKLGYVSPSTMQVPMELEDMLPDGVAVIGTNLGVRAHQAAEFDRAYEGIPAALDLLVGEGAQAIYLEGVPVAVRQGWAAEQQAHRTWSERVGVPVTSGFAAVVAALQHLGARRPVVATAYRDEWNDLIARYLADAGVAPGEVRGLSVQTPAEAGRVDATVFYQLARQLVDGHGEANAVVLGARGNLMPVALELERDFGLPVVFGTPAGLWWGLRQLGVSAPRGWGLLLDSLAVAEHGAGR